MSMNRFISIRVERKSDIDDFLLNFVFFFFGKWKVSFVTFRFKYARFLGARRNNLRVLICFFVHYTVEYLNNVLAAYKSAL